jgi:hypothetical protein
MISGDGEEEEEEEEELFEDAKDENFQVCFAMFLIKFEALLLELEVEEEEEEEEDDEVFEYLEEGGL